MTQLFTMAIKITQATCLLGLYILILRSTSKAAVNKEFLLQTIQELKINENHTIHNMMPLARSALDNKETLAHCYNPTFGSRELNIFNLTLRDLILGYYEEHNEVIDTSNAKQRVNNFITHLPNLTRLIESCVHKPKERRMQYGLTSVNAFEPDNWSKYLNFKLSSDSCQLGLGGYCNTVFNTYNGFIPETFNWELFYIKTPVKNQGQCGSCWIFAATAAVESAYMFKNKNSENWQFKGKPIVLSEQNTLDCFDEYDPCKGGLMDHAWKVMKQRGTVPVDQSPYHAIQQKNQCKSGNFAIKIADFCFQILPNTPIEDNELQKLILVKGPVVAALDASSHDFMYNKGEFHGDCNKKINHAITIVGWTKKYWIIKNSWGPNWGDKGYISLPRGENKCGINSVIGAVWL